MAEPQPSRLDLIYEHLRAQVSKISSSTLENEASLEGSKAVMQAIFASCRAFHIQAPGIPPPKPPAVASSDGVPAFPVPISKWGREHYRGELGNRDPAPEEKTEAANRVSRIASSLLGRDRTQLTAASKRALSIGVIGDCGRFAVHLPVPHAPLYLEEEEHLRAWKALLDFSWVPEWNPSLTLPSSPAPSSPTPPRGPKDRKDLPRPSR